MKKISFRKKQYFIKQAKKKHEYELKRKKRRKELKYQNLLRKIKHKNNRLFVDNPGSIQHKKFLAPHDFSLIADPTSVISFFEGIEKTLAKNIPVEFDLSEIEKMGPETLIYLCALIKEEDFTHNTAIKGNIPKNPVLREMFIKSGFYDHVISGFSSENEYTDPNDRLIYWKSNEKVESELASKICLSALKHTFNTTDIRKQKFFTVLIESMQNTWEHSNFGKENVIYNWWLLAYKEPRTKITKFCFLDLGVGVFGSLEEKFLMHKLPGWLPFNPNSHKKTMLGIFQGKRKTSTAKPERGRGINYIYHRVKKDKTIKNFTLLSNDIIAKFGYNAPDSIEKINANFEGTLYYWELTPEYVTG